MESWRHSSPSLPTICPPRAARAVDAVGTCARHGGRRTTAHRRRHRAAAVRAGNNTPAGQLFVPGGAPRPRAEDGRRRAHGARECLIRLGHVPCARSAPRLGLRHEVEHAHGAHVEVVAPEALEGRERVVLGTKPRDARARRVHKRVEHALIPKIEEWRVWRDAAAGRRAAFKVGGEAAEVSEHAAVELSRGGEDEHARIERSHTEKNLSLLVRAILCPVGAGGCVRDATRAPAEPDFRTRPSTPSRRRRARSSQRPSRPPRPGGRRRRRR
eukprot:7386788-Prymnesium_polylepis.1